MQADDAVGEAALVRQLEVEAHSLRQGAFAAGLVDQIELFLSPVIVGGGSPVSGASRTPLR